MAAAPFVFPQRSAHHTSGKASRRHFRAPRLRGLQARADAAAQTAGEEEKGCRRYAVVGGGFAGVATAWHLLQETHAAGLSAQVELYEAGGLGSGASGAAAGLLHPFTPRGKLLWGGLDGYHATLRLVQIADEARADQDEPLCMRDGILRYAANPKQARDFDKFVGGFGGGGEGGGVTAGSFQASTVTGPEVERLVPGYEAIAPEAPDASAAGEGDTVAAAGDARPRGAHGKPKKVHPPTATAGVLIANGTVLHPQRYLEGLWRACEAAAAAGPAASRAELRLQRVESLAALAELGGRYDAVVVAAGAAAALLPEVGPVVSPHLTLCRGQVMEMVPGSAAAAAGGGGGYPPGAPSLLGPTYIAAHDGGRRLMAGATKQYDVPPEAALRSGVAGEEEAAAAMAELQPRVQTVYPPLAEGWEVACVRTGVRAIPPRTPWGSLPLVGQILAAGQDEDGAGTATATATDEAAVDGDPAVWLHVGLGARGLVYHAWIAELLAKAIVHHDPALIPQEFRAWQQQRACTAAERA